MTEYRKPNAVVATVLASLATVVSLQPLFLTAGLAAFLMQDLQFGSAALGIAIAMARGAGAVTSPLLGRLADRLGSTRSIQITSLGAASASLGVAATANRWSVLCGWLMVSGCFQALGQPAANRLLAGLVSPGRLGIAFGIKQSAPPAASMLAGLSVPLIALPFGWRWAYVFAAILALIVTATIRPPPKGTRSNHRSIVKHYRLSGELLLLASAFGLGTAASSALTTFYVASAVDAGSGASDAGTIFAVASIAAIATRLLSGRVSDLLSAGHLRLCGGLVFAGGLGILLIGSGLPTWMSVGAILGMLGGWGFNGVFWFALIQRYPQAPGAVTGIVAPGALLGATLGPLAFGVVAQQSSYAAAWQLASVVSLVAALVMISVDRKLQSGPSPR